MSALSSLKSLGTEIEGKTENWFKILVGFFQEKTYPCSLLINKAELWIDEPESTERLEGGEKNKQLNENVISHLLKVE